MKRIIILLISAFLLTSFSFVIENNIDSNSNDDVKWDYFMLVQRWPQSSCEIVNASGHPCGFPSDIKRWTIHGLWPSGVDTFPFYCQNWTFDMSQVADLKHDLLLEWPNIYLNESVDSLWKHEYEKHGTCAASVDGFKHQHDYFQQTLNLAEKYDIQRVLEENRIYPRSAPYSTAQIHAAVNATSSKNRCLWCGHVQGVGQVLSQSIVCLDKQLQWIDCPVCEKPCLPTLPTYYQPLHYNYDYTANYV